MLLASGCKHPGKADTRPSSQLRALYDSQYSLILKQKSGSTSYYFYICHKPESPDTPTAIATMADDSQYCTNLFRHQDQRGVFFKLDALKPLTLSFNPENLNPQQREQYNKSLERIKQTYKQQIEDALAVTAESSSHPLADVSSGTVTAIAAGAIILGQIIKTSLEQPFRARVGLSDIILITTIAGSFEIFKMILDDRHHHQNTQAFPPAITEINKKTATNLDLLLEQHHPSHFLLLHHYKDLIDNTALSRIPSIPTLAQELALYLNESLIKNRSGQAASAITQICIPNRTLVSANTHLPATLQTDTDTAHAICRSIESSQPGGLRSPSTPSTP